MEAPAPESSLVILKRYDRELVLLNEISKNDSQAPTGIAWVDRSSMQTNMDRIIAWADLGKNQATLRNAWTTGVISTLKLAKLKLRSRFRNSYFETINLNFGPRYVSRFKSYIPKKLQ